MLVGQEKKETGKERGQGRLRQRRNNNPQDLKTDGLKASKFSPCQVHSANSGLKKKTTSSFGKFRKKKCNFWLISFFVTKWYRKFLTLHIHEKEFPGVAKAIARGK